ncbi:hypothetical protein MSG28_002810 [Choristoneura fumiferana]|uniref:Uncharacterized protein n=1 Tax=Choristoneura fumiferana TaxID=7141 RepID=A0ACC0JJK6_CHOFU|nr:hypothetical protein MSG28_002810 [Choristoneura fumiferana]
MFAHAFYARVRHILTNYCGLTPAILSGKEVRSVATLRRPAVITELKVAGETVTRPGHKGGVVWASDDRPLGFVTFATVGATGSVASPPIGSKAATDCYWA